MSVLIELRDIGKSFFTAEIETRAVSGINLQISKGEYVALSGPSGCGKSSLLAILGLLDEPTTGSYLLDKKDVSSLSRNEMASIRNQHVGFIFQSFNLISESTVEENVRLPLTYRSGVSKSDIDKKVAWVLDKVEMSHRASHFPSQLSGGQQQRVAVSRALINDPSIILADEPTGNLDSNNSELVMELLSRLHKDGSTICMVTHDPVVAQRAGRQIEMLDGSIHLDEPTQLDKVG